MLPAQNRALVLKISVAALTAAASLALLAGPASADREELFRFADPRITESSGLAVSTRHEGVVYTHNDSDDGPHVYAVGPDGRTRAVLTLRGVQARDWEGMAPGRDGQGRPVLWIGDIGDNGGGWWEEIWVYRLREPARLHTRDVRWTRYRLRYADGARDAEALLVDPRTQRLYVVSKEPGTGGVYAAPARLRTDGINVLRRVAEAPSGITDGAFLTDGSAAVLRGYAGAGLYDRDWGRMAEVSLPLQFQGESLAAVPAEGAVLVGSEGDRSSVWKVALPGLASPSPSPPAQTSVRSPALPAADRDRDARSSFLGTALLIAAGVAALVLWRRRRDQ